MVAHPRPNAEADYRARSSPPQRRCRQRAALSENYISFLFGLGKQQRFHSPGRRVIEKHAGKAQLGELDYLLESPDDRAGALGFGLNKVPPAPQRKFNKTLDLEKLQNLAHALIKDEIPKDPDAAQVQDLILLGTSMGGARPKAVVQDDQGLWIAKFNRPDDRWNNTRVEQFHSVPLG
jgi:hypothetical protein